MPTYSFITLSQAVAALALRLNDPNLVQYSFDELQRYITESLRSWNALTSVWNTDYVFSVTPPASSIWIPLRGVAGYPRQQTVSDTDIYKIIQYHFLEPPTGGTWTGTPQFSINDLSGALQRRRDEIIQISSCNPVSAPLPSIPNTRRTVLPDSTLQVVRNRFVPATGFGSPVTLVRDDSLSFEYFTPGYLQNQQGNGQAAPTYPQAYSVIAGPPESIDVDYTPTTPGAYDLILLQSGASFSPPSSTLLGIPDDFSWLAKWGAMADLLSSGSEKQDAMRAQYCLQRYKDGLVLMQQAPWITLAQINGVAADTPAVAEMDAYVCEWDSNPAAPSCVVTAGTDLIALSPVPTTGGPVGVGLTVIGNAPVPVLAGDFIQCSRDVIDVILDYSEHLASFKKGGAEFVETMDLAKNFALSALSTNVRLKQLGIFRDLLLGQGQREKRQDGVVGVVNA